MKKLLRIAAGRLLKLNVDLGILNVYLENLIFNLIGLAILNVALQMTTTDAIPR